MTDERDQDCASCAALPVLVELRADVSRLAEQVAKLSTAQRLSKRTVALIVGAVTVLVQDAPGWLSQLISLL